MLNGHNRSAIVEEKTGGATIVMTTQTEIDTIHVPLDKDLIGQPIRVSDAAEKYDISHVNLIRWADAGYITVIERGPKLLELDEADVKRVTTIFETAKRYTSPRRAGWVLKKSVA
jgi:hypothetical protein